MKFGLALPYNSTRVLPDWARWAEEAGWDGVFLGDAVWTEDPMIGLAAAAVTTRHIKLGTLIIPVPLRRPWKIASEALAVDLLSDGRLILGLGAGAVWMGWQGFPDEVTDTKARAGMLDETIDIIGRLNRREQFDFDGTFYHLKLTQVDTMHYPPKTVQQPRVPIWVPGLWPREKSMQRILKCDGILPEKINAEGAHEEITPADVREIKAYIDTNRTLKGPFDIAITGKTAGLGQSQQRDIVRSWEEAGATWWIEDLLAEEGEAVVECIRSGYPNLEA